MTIPISPGPFNFLESIGSGLGAIGQRRDEVANQKRKQAQEQAGLILALIRDKVAKPETLDHPAFQQALQGMELGGGLGSQDIQTDPQADMLRALFSKYNAGETLTPEQQQTLSTGRPVGPYEIPTAKATLESLQAEPGRKAAQETRANAAATLDAKRTELAGKDTEYQRQQVEIAMKRLGLDASELKDIQVDEKTGKAVGITKQGKVVPLDFTPQAKPGTGPGGVKLKPIPATTVKGLVSNKSAVTAIDQAVTGINDDPNAVGHWWNALPDFFVQRLDRKGVPTRADVANVGSIVYFNRSGKAVTVREDQRLRPFIPNATDPPVAAKQKLGKLRDFIRAENDAYLSYYTAEKGFQPFDEAAIAAGTPSGAAQSVGPKRALTDAEKSKAKSDPAFARHIGQYGYTEADWK